MPSAPVEFQEQKCSKMEEKLAELQCIMEKKMRNLDKRKNRLELYKSQLAEGKTLSPDQTNAVEAYTSVSSNLDVYKEMLPIVKTIVKENNDTKNKIEVQSQHDQLKMMLRYQDVLHQLHNENVRDDFLAGRLSSVKLSEENLQQLMDLEEIISMPIDEKRSSNYEGIKEQINTCAENFGYLLDGANIPFQDTTFVDMKLLVNSIATCCYPKQPKPKKEYLPQQQYHNNQIAEMNMLINQTHNMHLQQGGNFNQVDMSNGFPQNSPLNYNHMLSDIPMPVPGPYYNQSHIPTLEISDLMTPSNINFLQESQLRQEAPAVYMDPAVVSFGTIKPETLMQMHEQLVQPVPVETSPVRNEEPLVYHQPESSPTSHPPEQPLPIKPQEPEPVKTSWAEESIDHWPNEINGESNVWNGKPESMNWSDDVEDRRNSFRNKPNIRRSNYGGNYRGRGYNAGNYSANRGGNFGAHGYRGRGTNGFNSYRPNLRGNGSSNYNRGTNYRTYRGAYQNQQQRTD